jgi:hypothetical protein
MKTRKELKEEYKQMKFKMGVFQIRNTLNTKIFIGSSLDLDAAWNSQNFQLKAGLHQNNELQKEWLQFGAENFSYEILEIFKPKDDLPTNYSKDLKTLESLFIEELQPFENKGYHTRK